MVDEVNTPPWDTHATRQSCPNDDDTPEEPKIKIRAALFFDGTLNNRTNVQVGPAGAPFLGFTDSYENDFSNVSRLEGFWQQDQAADHSFSLYVEGIGTENRGRDNLQGMALGTGGTGVKGKVRRGIRHLISRIDSVASNPNIEYVHLDAFGFSRGAAAARYFVHAVLHGRHSLANRLAARGYTVDAVQVKFIGLFDTVASYGRDHSNDTRELRLNAIRDAERVVQLAAAEEHRKNFRLTNIASASNGLEIFLPGVHSDVGGGYVDGASEEDIDLLDLGMGHANSRELIRLVNERQWFVDKGWNRLDEIEVSMGGNKIRGSRRRIRHHYDRIPLRLMARLAGDGGVRVSRRIAMSHPIPPALNAIRDMIDEYVAGLGRSRASDWINNNSSTMKSLRHDYLHHSAHYDGIGTPHEPQWTRDDPMNGRRRRTIQHG